MVAEKFTQPFINFLENNNNIKHHKFLVCGETKKYPITSKKHTKIYGSARNMLLNNAIAINKSEKIFLHGLFDIKILAYFYTQPWLLKKCYWIIWGSDLYSFQKEKNTWKLKLEEILRKSVIKKMGNIVSLLEGDYMIAQNIYKTKAKYHNSFVYTSNIFERIDLPEQPKKTISIQIGNSADPSNEHLEIIKLLTPFKNRSISIHAPLSYGNQAYADAITKEGENIFGHKFKALREIIPSDEYIEFLSNIDIAIFNHKRQQAMGNTITLLGLGKKVYIRDDVTPWKFFQQIGVKVYNTNKIDLELLPENVKLENREKIKEYFSKENLNKQLKKLFGENN